MRRPTPFLCGASQGGVRPRASVLHRLGRPLDPVGMGRLIDVELVRPDGREVLLEFREPRPILAWDSRTGGRRLWTFGGRYTVLPDGTVYNHGGADPLRRVNRSEVPGGLLRAYVAKHWGLDPLEYVAWSVAVPPWACILGRVKAVSYHTAKKGDGPSDYRHAFARYRPALAVGPGATQIFWEGRGYLVTDHGIEDL